MQSSNTAVPETNQLFDDEPVGKQAKQRQPRLRAIIEFMDGDFSQPPVVFPCAGNEEADEVLRREIQRLWNRD
jgi:hypothetical protein